MTINKRFLILCRGCSGAGKSTLALMLAKSFNGRAFAADDFFMLSGEYKWDASLLDEAHKWCREAVEDEIQNGTGIAIVHNTLVTESAVKEYADIAERTDATLISLIVERRHSGKNTHGVSDEKVQKQGRQLRQAIKLC